MFLHRKLIRVTILVLLNLSIVLGVSAQEKVSKRMALGVSQLFPDDEKLNRAVSIYGEYRFNDWLGIGAKGVFENKAEDSLNESQNKYFIYMLATTPVAKDNNFVFLKPAFGVGFREGDKDVVFDASLNVNFYLIEDLLYSGIGTSVFIIPGSKFRAYTGITLGICF